MPNNYHIIKQLLVYLEKSQMEENDPTIEGFANWYSGKMDDNAINLASGESHQKVSVSLDETVESGRDVNQDLITMIFRLSKCQDFYVKKFFDGLPVNTLIEYNFLYTLNKGDALKKTDIIYSQMVEYTTGIDVLRRLNRLDLISEFRDPANKRNKIIHITSEGKRILVEAMLRMNKMYEIFLGIVPVDKRQDAAEILKELYSFHNKIFAKFTNKSYFEIIKHLEQSNT